MGSRKKRTKLKSIKKSLAIVFGNPDPSFLAMEGFDFVVPRLEFALHSSSMTFDDPSIDRQAILDSLRKNVGEFFELVVRPAVLNEKLPPSSVPGQVTASLVPAARCIDPYQHLSEELLIYPYAHCRIKVDLQPPRIVLDSKVFEGVPPDAVGMVDLLIKARGRLVTRKTMRDELGENFRPPRAKDDLPSEIASLIFTGDYGHRLEQAAWLQ